MRSNLDSGSVLIRLTCVNDQVSSVLVLSERPDVMPVLRGRTSAQAVKLVSMLFALCGQAQACAGTHALAAARGTACEPYLDPSVQKEVLREHLWRWMLDLPPLLGEAAMQKEFVIAAQLLNKDARAELQQLLSNPRITSMRSQLSAMNESRSSPLPLLPILDAISSLKEWPRLDNKFSRLPEWHGAAAETGAIARYPQQAQKVGSFFSSRWLARLNELLDWCDGKDQVGAGGTVSSACVANNIGRSLVETARGLLMHEIILDGDRVQDYVIVAPTEWNFHPQGVLPKLIQGTSTHDRDALQHHVALLIATLDPCVPWVLEWA